MIAKQFAIKTAVDLVEFARVPGNQPASQPASQPVSSSSSTITRSVDEDQNLPLSGLRPEAPSCSGLFDGSITLAMVVLPLGVVGDTIGSKSSVE